LLSEEEAVNQPDRFSENLRPEPRHLQHLQTHAHMPFIRIRRYSCERYLLRSPVSNSHSLKIARRTEPI
jgi:hypothetical protein